MAVPYPPPSRPPASTAAPPASPWNWLRLAIGGGAYVGVLLASVLTRGVPLEREQVLLWVMGALAVVAVSGPRHRARQVIVDWLPFLLVLVVYDYSRGLADQAGFPVRWQPQIRADELLFGGQLPTVWLQEQLIDPARVHTWEVVVAVTYASHFVVPFVVAATLWFRDRARWAAFVRRFVVLSFLGVVTFVLVPTGPPWLAAQTGRLDEAVARPVGRGWSVLGLDIAERVLEKGQASVNLTAAVPSLHAAYAALIAVVLWPSVRWLSRLVLAAYTVGMGFVLVLGGEHYVVDIAIGWAYVALTMLVVGQTEQWWRRRRDRAGQLPPESESSPPDVMSELISE